MLSFLDVVLVALVVPTLVDLLVTLYKEVSRTYDR